MKRSIKKERGKKSTLNSSIWFLSNISRSITLIETSFPVTLYMARYTIAEEPWPITIELEQVIHEDEHEFENEKIDKKGAS